MKKTVLVTALILVIALLGISAVSADSRPLTTLTFDELPFQPVDGLSFQGVNFSFEIGGVPSSDAHYNSFGPGWVTHVQDPSLEGSAFGTLSLEFDKPTTIIEFGVTQSCGGPSIPDAVTVTLHRLGKGFVRETVDLTLDPLVSFVEGQYAYRGPAAKTMVVDFTDSCGRFAFDNLVYHEGEED